MSSESDVIERGEPAGAPDDRVFEFTLSLSESDLCDFFRFALRNYRKQGQRQLVSVALGAAAVALLAFWFWNSTGRGLALLFISSCVAAVLIAYALWWDWTWKPRVTRRVQQAVADSPTFATSTACRVTPEGIEAHDELIDAVIRWPAILKIGETSDHCFLFLNSENAYIIPRRAFDSDDAFEHFISACRRWRSQHPPASGTCPDCGYSLQNLHQDGCPECGWGRVGGGLGGVESS